MTPTLVFENGKPVLVVGSPGGSRIITTVLGLSADTTLALTKMGYHMVPLEIWGAGNAAQLVGIAPAGAPAAP